MSNGTFATNDEYPYIGFITDPRCSAILITPGWVLTAAHCIDGGEAGSACGFSDPPTNTNGPLDSYIMHLFNDPIGGPTPIPQQFVHTQPISGVVHTILKRAIDSCSDEDAALDLALVRLDRRVPLSLVTPKHPINGHCSPQLEINGTIIGYGPTFGLADDNGADVPQRTYTTSAGWTLTSVSTGNIYQNFWQFPLAPPWVPGEPEFWYDGPLKGDSGGALIDADTGNLCGVVSRFYPTGVHPFAFMGASMAALDSTAAKDFLNEFIFDRAGNFLGECSTGPEALRDTDTDGDLIPDACDPCPDVREPTVDGLFVEPDDFDNDGVPDACDICPTISNPRNIVTNEQADEDNDGIGNQCDLCPHSDDIVHFQKVDDVVCCANDGDCGLGKCFPAAATSNRFGHCAAIGGRCEGSVDLDFDLIGESCDPCPGTFSPTFSDMDGDGVGDASMIVQELPMTCIRKT